MVKGPGRMSSLEVGRTSTNGHRQNPIQKQHQHLPIPHPHLRLLYHHISHPSEGSYHPTFTSRYFLGRPTRADETNPALDLRLLFKARSVRPAECLVVLSLQRHPLAHPQRRSSWLSNFQQTTRTMPTFASCVLTGNGLPLVSSSVPLPRSLQCPMSV